MQQGAPLLRVEKLRTYFSSREGVLRAVDGVDFEIGEGETVGIAGESGCGKSVTAQSIMRLVPANGRIVSGRILLNSKKSGNGILDLTELDPEGSQIRKIRGAEISMIFQEPMTSFSPVHTVGDQITEAIILHQRVSRTDARDEAIQLLAKVGMPKPAQTIDAYSFNLSGGMRQRAMVAMALSCQPSLLIADEPTTAVDVTIQAQVLELMQSLQIDFKMALMIITHDMAVIAELADRVLIMYLGKSVEYASADEIFYNAKHPYTRGLLASIPKLHKGRERIEPIVGAVPTPYDMPLGCPFHPRCSECIPELCEKKEPPALQVGEEHMARCFLYNSRDRDHNHKIEAELDG